MTFLNCFVQKKTKKKGLSVGPGPGAKAVHSRPQSAWETGRYKGREGELHITCFVWFAFMGVFSALCVRRCIIYERQSERKSERDKYAVCLVLNRR